MLLDFLFNLVFPGLALLAVKAFHNPGYFIRGKFAHVFFNIFRHCVIFKNLFFLAHFSLNLLLPGHQLLNFLMGQHDGFQHFFFSYFLSARFHHHNGVLSARNSKIQHALFPLLAVRIDNVSPVHHADRNAAGGPVKGNIRNGKRYGRTNHGVYLRGNIIIHAHGRGHNLHVIIKALGE